MNYRTVIERHREKLFLESPNHKLTFGALDRRAGQWRTFLKDKGLQPGDVVALQSRFITDVPALPFACWSLGLVFMPVDPRLKDETLAQIKKDVEIKLFIPGEFHPPLKAVSDASFNFDPDSGKAALAILTSGSSGRAKCAVLSLRNLFFSAQSLAHFFNLREGDRWLHVLPDFHIGGFSIWIRCFIRGATVVSHESVRNIAIKNLTHMSLVAAQLRTLLEQGITAPEQLRVVLLGGSAIPPALLGQALQGSYPVYSSYGLTEMASTVAVKKHFDPRNTQPEEALILPGREVKLSGGEILVKGETLFMGYFQKGCIASPRNEQGWFATGDLGRLSDDRLTVTGRRDNMFISGGENIQPEEIERHLMRLAGVENVLVLPRPDDRFGHRAVAVVSLSRKLTATDIKSFMADHLPAYKIPDSFFHWPAEGHSGIKWRRGEMLKMLLEGSLAVVK